MLNLQRISFYPCKADPYFAELEHSGDPLQLDVVRSGLASVQDVSQGLVAKLLDPQPGEKILDLCAAPGGKSGHLAELCADCSVVATDKDQGRLESVRHNVGRCGYPNVEVRSYDQILTDRSLQFDAVLVDAPCTGTGVLARRPDLRWRRRPADIMRMQAVQ